jgi:hypothetical protein
LGLSGFTIEISSCGLLILSIVYTAFLKLERLVASDEIGHHFGLLPEVLSLGLDVTFKLYHRTVEIDVLGALKIFHGSELILLENEVVNAVIILVRDDFSVPILSKLRNVVRNSE